jgi:nicotinamidase-related amidase
VAVDRRLSDLHGAVTEDTYARAGFGAPVPRGPRPALVVVDLTRGFTEPTFAAGADLSDVVAATAELVDAARASDTPVIWTAISYTTAEAEGDAVAWLRKAQGMRAMRAGSVQVDLDPRLPVRPEDHHIMKKGASAFSGTALAGLLTSLETTTVVVTGATTSGCVRATAVDAVQSGWDTLVVAEACGDRARGPHEAALFDLDAKYADVASLDDARDYLLSTNRASTTKEEDA